MKIHSIAEMDMNMLDLYDLYYLLREPCTVTFKHHGYGNGNKHVVFSEREGNSIAVNLDGKWFRSIDDMMIKGKLDDRIIPMAAYGCSITNISKNGQD